MVIIVLYYVSAVASIDAAASVDFHSSCFGKTVWRPQLRPEPRWVSSQCCPDPVAGVEAMAAPSLRTVPLPLLYS